MLTPFQTVGPYLSLGLRATPAGEEPGAITISGRLLDGQRQGIPDGLLEFWHPTFAAVQRALTSDDGTFRVSLRHPASVAGAEGHAEAPHLAVRVLGRGILTQYITRIYFPDEPLNDADHVLALVPPERRHTLLATRRGVHDYVFDVVVQGDDETVFFDV